MLISDWSSDVCSSDLDPLERRIDLGMLSFARRDVERLEQMLAIQSRLLDPHAPPRAQRALLHRPALPDALPWLETHGARPDPVRRPAERRGGKACVRTCISRWSQ